MIAKATFVVTLAALLLLLMQSKIVTRKAASATNRIESKSTRASIVGDCNGKDDRSRDFTDIWQQYKRWHSQESLESEFGPFGDDEVMKSTFYDSNRKFVVGYYSCPYQGALEMFVIELLRFYTLLRLRRLNILL